MGILTVSMILLSNLVLSCKAQNVLMLSIAPLEITSETINCTLRNYFRGTAENIYKKIHNTLIFDTEKLEKRHIIMKRRKEKGVSCL